MSLALEEKHVIIKSINSDIQTIRKLKNKNEKLSEIFESKLITLPFNIALSSVKTTADNYEQLQQEIINANMSSEELFEITNCIASVLMHLAQLSRKDLFDC